MKRLIKNSSDQRLDDYVINFYNNYNWTDNTSYKIIMKDLLQDIKTKFGNKVYLDNTDLCIYSKDDYEKLYEDMLNSPDDYGYVNKDEVISEFPNFNEFFKFLINTGTAESITLSLINRDYHPSEY